ncbi:hypothetical protein E2C01_055154 [Portunus trituberculatus]|uniref:Uncharacterized protein n=1 Tax=Portunus trituberculatus TaxID=210409 RepID=A0A5B7GLL0_PORTR|nr:hypothetical protein [Portunus trituberculatus]
MADDILSSAEENVVAASVSQAASPISEGCGVTKYQRGSLLHPRQARPVHAVDVTVDGGAVIGAEMGGGLPGPIQVVGRCPWVKRRGVGTALSHLSMRSAGRDPKPLDACSECILQVCGRGPAVLFWTSPTSRGAQVTPEGVGEGLR